MNERRLHPFTVLRFLRKTLVVYLLPQLSGGGLSPLADLPHASAWTLRQSRSFGNGICRLVYRKKAE